MSDDRNAHPDEATLHEFLDGALDPEIRCQVETHVSLCTSCSARLQEIKAVFVSLETLPERPLGRDLTPGVMAAIRPMGFLPRGFRVVLAVQAIGIISALFLGWSSFRAGIEELYITLLGTYLVDGANTLSNLLAAAWFDTLSILDRLIIGSIECIDLPLRVSWPLLDKWLWIAVLTMLWFIGNRLLLRGFPSGLKPR
jgi:anti-sigma factor RsiW